MEDTTRKEFRHSLDLTTDVLEKYIPELLKGLWELGSVPEYVIELMARNNLGTHMQILDLGCGKGAVLVKVAQQFDIKALGVDIVPDFIEEANLYANTWGVSDKVEFKTEDILETLKATTSQDLVIYGYDSEILGDLKTTLSQLAKCMKADGYIILEYMFSDLMTDTMVSNNDMKDILDQSGYRILDRIDWNKEKLKQTNKENTIIIKENVQRLIAQYPDEKEAFKEYLQNQIDECEELENKYTCTTLLLRPHLP